VGYGGTCGTYNPTPSEDLEIRDWYDLDDIGDNLQGDHKLMNDLDSTTAGYQELAGPTANGGKGWQPIPVPMPETPGFGGTFDGQGHEVRDLFINRADENGVGLFSGTSQVGVIKDLGVTNFAMTGADGVGGLVGSNRGSIINCYSSGNMTGQEEVGSLAGHNGGSVSNCYSSGTVTGNSSVGGLAGSNGEHGTVDGSHSTCAVTALDKVGGLVGCNWGGTISNSHSTANVSGYSDVGGLVGLNEKPLGYLGQAAISNSYSIGSITGHERVGGLVGYSHYGTESNSYSTCSVTGHNCVGGLVGMHDKGGVSYSFWDRETSGQSTSDGGTGKNTTEMHDITTFSDVGWNIIAVALNDTNPAYTWNIVNNVTYPFLGWQS